MRFIITDSRRRSPEEAVESKLASILSRLSKTGKQIQDGLLWTVRNHFRTIYPGSNHYSPDKVQPYDHANGAEPFGEIEVDVPGITRAYGDLTIKPKFRKALTIPMHRSAYGKKAADFADAFVLRKKNGKQFLVQGKGGSLVFLFYLAKSAFQKRNPNLMPSDENLGDNVGSRIFAYLTSGAK